MRGFRGTRVTEEFDRRGSFPGGWEEARRLLWERRYRLGLGFLLVVVNRLAGMVLPATSKFLVDEVIGNQRADLLFPLAALVGAATLVHAGTSYSLSLVLGVAAQHSIAEMRKRLYEHVSHLPVRYFDSTQTGVLISRIMSDAEGIRNLVGSGLVQMAGGLLTALVALGVLFYLNWRLTVVTLLVLAGFGAIMAFAFKRLRPIFRERGRIRAEVTGRLAQSLSGIRVVKAYTAEEREHEIFARGVGRLFDNIARTIKGVSGVTAFSALTLGLVGLLMIVLGGRAVLEGTMTLGDLVMYVVFTALVAAPLVQIASVGTQLTEAIAGLDRIRELLAVMTEDGEDTPGEPISGIRGDVEFHDVSFEYEPGVPVLKNVSFRAPAGTTTALVGPSGSGKSTLIGLVMAFHRPRSGRITLDGADLWRLRLRDYRSHLGVVLQENFLFDGTIAENIRFSRPEADLDEVMGVARIAHCEEFAESLPLGYETVVGERGVKLSGGQRQRVAIARAILSDPAILILDEATSSLDSESEAKIQDGLRALRRGRTTFVIAHRLSTIRSADQILVLDDGEVVERGTHAELVGAGGRYQQLHEKQYQLELDRFVNPGEELAPGEETPALVLPEPPADERDF